LPLPATTLSALAEIAVGRRDFSGLRLAAQLEHHRTQQPITGELELAVAAMAVGLYWDTALAPRLWAVIGPVVDRTGERADPLEQQLLASIEAGDTASREVYADWLDERSDHRCAAFLRSLARPADARDDRLGLLVDATWRARVAR
jgi:uncharacterized protein (TIGR02996 family)